MPPTLDQNQDGRLTAEELRPSDQPGRGGPGPQRGGPEGHDGERPSGPGRQGEAHGGRGGGRRGQGERGGGRGGDPAQADAAFGDQMVAFDTNKDGLFRQAEIPEQMHDAFSMADDRRRQPTYQHGTASIQTGYPSNAALSLPFSIACFRNESQQVDRGQQPDARSHQQHRSLNNRTAQPQDQRSADL